ncbi:ABC transporter ATP-binding protein [Acidicapsa acidisoli]|uniref:ABC transporter ATP-binding protein n=1 Tax=Acidicapsa acidisoli TaxID=1615681 RepID=UPI0021DFFB46|nr:ATP-binding cassette domain-containing protein [Acidicapsa acidisoli]
MIEFQIEAKRGGFHLEIECCLSAPWTVVFGPSGAGKSTLLRIIAGLEEPDSGHITIYGQPVTNTRARLNLRPGRRSTGLVAQKSALFPHISVAANVAYGLASWTQIPRQQRVADMLELVGAAHLVDRSPRALSGGEAQRVSLARALAPMPRLLLLDEPLSALDADARDQILIRLQAWLREQAIQTILVTHDAADALATEAEVALIREGKLAALGPASEVLATERQRLLARLNAG